MADRTNPTHYRTLNPEPIDVAEAWQKHWPENVRYHLATALKYIGRCGIKHEDPTEDLEKASWFLQRALAQLGLNCATVEHPQNPDCTDTVARRPFNVHQKGDCSTFPPDRLAANGVTNWQAVACNSCNRFYQLDHVPAQPPEPAHVCRAWSNAGPDRILRCTDCGTSVAELNRAPAQSPKPDEGCDCMRCFEFKMAGLSG